MMRYGWRYLGFYKAGSGAKNKIVIFRDLKNIVQNKKKESGESLPAFPAKLCTGLNCPTIVSVRPTCHPYPY
jgi:hypothetical protein